MCIAGIGYIAVITFISIYSWVPELLDREAKYRATASTSVASNVVFCVLPTPWILKLKMFKRTKFVAIIAISWGIV
jgi:peptidoglycan biosynthesis protein MviN/MurJ (putative lipid II flippase)